MTGSIIKIFSVSRSPPSHGNVGPDGRDRTLKGSPLLLEEKAKPRNPCQYRGPGVQTLVRMTGLEPMNNCSKHTENKGIIIYRVQFYVQ